MSGAFFLTFHSRKRIKFTDRTARFTLKTHLRFLLFLLLACSAAHGQNQQLLDSLRKRIAGSTDTALASAYNDLAWAYRKTNADSARKYVHRARVLANQLDYEPAIDFSIYMLGIINDFNGNFDSALLYYNQSYQRYKLRNDEKGMASALNNIGAVYSLTGKNDKALDYYFRSLRIKEKIGDVKGTGSSYNNIGIIFESQRQFDKALEFYKRSLEVKKRLGNKEQLATTFSNISGIYQEMKQYDVALAYADSAVTMHKELEEWNGLALTYNSIANIYTYMMKNDLALKYHHMGLELQEKIGDKWGATYSMVGIAEVYLALKEFQNAVEYSLRGIQKASEIGALKETVKGYECLFEAYDLMGKKAEAIAAVKTYIKLKDSLINIKNQEALAELQTKFEVTEKEKQIESLNKENIIQEKEAKQQRLVRNFVLGIAGVLMLLAIVIFKGYRAKKKANEILHEQKNQLDRQNQIIEEKNRLIGESIDYARYIQEAVLPSITIESLISDSFLIYKPKDIVSGDFYWLEKKDDVVFIAAADCTGHGIPGAFMSLIGTMLLNEIFNEKKIHEPGRMLSELNRLLKISLKQQDTSFTNRNGMDIIMCAVDLKNHAIQFAGANRPLYVLANASSEVQSYPSEKVAIGGLTPDDYVFRSTTVQLKKDDSFYLFSDGFADQFGGEKGKKLTTKRFKDLLVSYSDRSMIEQQVLLQNSFDNWKGEREQVDDVLLIGARI